MDKDFKGSKNWKKAFLGLMVKEFGQKNEVRYVNEEQ
jgi:hypothetical protein